MSADRPTVSFCRSSDQINSKRQELFCTSQAVVSIDRSIIDRAIANYLLRQLLVPVMSTGGEGGKKKRPRADLLSTLDAAFASTAQSTDSKYTAQATAQAVPQQHKQQAYQHLKRKRKDEAKRMTDGNGQRQKGRDRTAKESEEKHGKKQTEAAYEKMSTELLAIGLKDCSLVSYWTCAGREEEGWRCSEVLTDVWPWFVAASAGSNAHEAACVARDAEELLGDSDARHESRLECRW